MSRLFSTYKGVAITSKVESDASDIQSTLIKGRHGIMKLVSCKVKIATSTVLKLWKTCNSGVLEITTVMTPCTKYI